MAAPCLLVEVSLVQRLDSKGRTTGCRTAGVRTTPCQVGVGAVEGVHVDHASTVVVSVRPSARAPSRCGRRSSRPRPRCRSATSASSLKPAQLRFSSKPIPHGPSADTKYCLPLGSHSRSTDPNPSSPSHYSPSAATHHGSQAETNPHISSRRATYRHLCAARVTDQDCQNAAVKSR